MMNAQIILQPIVSEKSFAKSEEAIYTFRVARTANKKLVKDEVEKRFKVKVTKVNILNRRDRRIMDFRKKIAGRKPGYKKAIVTLKSGDTIDLFK
jgi:large subunit ribosomal protein L23